MLTISPHGRALLEEDPSSENKELPPGTAQRIAAAFEQGSGPGLLHLATTELTTALPASLAYARDFAREFLTLLCRAPMAEETGQLQPIAPPPPDVLAMRVMAAPPMKGLEYFNADVLGSWWEELNTIALAEISAHRAGAEAWLRQKNPLWRLVGRVTFHLAENKRDEGHPFAFVATYASRLSAQGKVQHLPLSRALQEYASARDKSTLISLLTPVHRASEKSELVRELIQSNRIYQALAWTPREAYRFLRDVPAFEESGLIVRVPDWWKPASPPRPQVSVTVGRKLKSALSVDSLLDFSVGVALEGQEIPHEELLAAMQSTDGLVRLRGKWVEIDKEKLQAALDHWKKVEQDVRGGGISFFEGMRLLAGAPIGADAAASVNPEVRQWTGIQAGDWLHQTLAELRDPQRLEAADPHQLKADLRPYQQTGVSWLRFMSRLGLGACLADDMGLGKTVQMLGVLMDRRRERLKDPAKAPPDLLVVPASLIANWKAEIARFAPELSAVVAHSSESEFDPASERELDSALARHDLLITTYGILVRLETLRKRQWGMIILDEAQAIKNAGTRQTRAVKELQSTTRVALTGTPVENRLGDLWSIFDFLNPGLLGSARQFGSFVKSLDKDDHQGYGPLRTLIQPYILRRLKTDKRIISDLPDKTELRAFCTLSRQQAALYEQSVKALAEQIRNVDGIERRGVVLAYLMRLKQICNHPSQWLGDNTYDAKLSGKFARLGEICQELAERQEKVLVFTQFREMWDPLESTCRHASLSIL